MAKRTFEFIEGTSSKFWEIWIDGNSVYTRYGKIGADGQTTVKDQGSPEDAKKLHDKLVKEKTGKGYVEAGAGSTTVDEDLEDAASGHAARWAGIAKQSGKGLVAALEKEWAFLCATPKCKQVMSYLLAKVKSASVEDDKLTVVFEDRFDDETIVICNPPATEDISRFPKSWQAFMRQYDGMWFGEDAESVGFNGSGGSGAFDTSYIEESDPELYEKAISKDLEFEVPFDYGQDWVVAHPFKKNKLGEPALYFFSHEGGGLEDAYPADLSAGAVFLRLMAKQMTDKDFFEKTQAVADDDDSDDDDDGEDGGGEGVRRFEFSEDSSNKFWEIKVEGESHTVRYGKVGTDGQTKTKEFESAQLAKKDADKLIAEKTKKGYEEV